MDVFKRLKSVLIFSTFICSFSYAFEINEVNDETVPLIGPSPVHHSVTDSRNSVSPYPKGLKRSNDETRALLKSRSSILYRLSGKTLLSDINPDKPLPASADLTESALIMNQGNIGSCTGNAAAQCLYVKAKATKMPSRLFIYYEERAHMTKMEGINYIPEDSGASIADAQWVIQNVGAPAEEPYWPYVESKFATKPSQIAYDHAKDYISLSSEEIPVSKDLTLLKRALSKGYPVAAGIMVYPSFETSTVKKTGYVPLPNPKKEFNPGGHAVTILGYDDKETYDGYTGYFTLANSWGNDWGLSCHGQRGFFKLPYQFVQNSNFTVELWAITSVKMENIVAKLSPRVYPAESKDSKDRKDKEASALKNKIEDFASNAVTTVTLAANNAQSLFFDFFVKPLSPSVPTLRNHSKS